MSWTRADDEREDRLADERAERRRLQGEFSPSEAQAIQRAIERENKAHECAEGWRPNDV